MTVVFLVGHHAISNVGHFVLFCDVLGNIAARARVVMTS